MIHKLEIANFLGHENTSLTFTTGLNIIVGSSDLGKSAIIKAIIWNLFNKPGGFSFKRTGSENENTFVDIRFGEGRRLKRSRDKHENEYDFQGEVFKALRSGVPPEIENFINLPISNVQKQFDPYFLLQSTPGDVAKELNQISNLSLIDEVIQRINSIVKEAKTNAEIAENRLSEAEDRLLEFDGLPSIKKLINSSETALSQVSFLAEKKEKVENILQEIEEEAKTIEEINEWLKIEGKVNKILSALEEVQKETDFLDSVIKLIKEIEEINQQIKELNSFLSLEERADHLLRHITTFDGMITELTAISFLVSEIEKFSSIKEETQNKINSLEEEYKKLLKEAKICPTCGANEDNWNVKAVI